MNPREKRTATQPGLGQVPEDSRRTAVRARVLLEGEVADSTPISGSTNPRHTRALESVPARTTEIAPKPPGAKRVDRRGPTQPGYEGEVEGRPRSPVTSRPPGAKPPSSRAVGRGVPSYPPERVAESTPSSSRRARSLRASIHIDDLGEAVVSAPDAMGGSARGRQVPKIVRTKAEIADAPIDHRAGFLLAHIDGVTSVQGLVDIAGMPENEVHEIIERLRRLGIVAIR